MEKQKSLQIIHQGEEEEEEEVEEEEDEGEEENFDELFELGVCD